MVAIQVYEADGTYMSNGGGESFIELAPGKRTDVYFVSFCLDFDKDNPSVAEAFTIDPSPTQIEPVLQRIMDHLHRNSDADLVVSGQVAVWLAKGVGIERIRDKMGVSASEERLARAFAQ
jgi:hypothetical protein